MPKPNRSSDPWTESDRIHTLSDMAPGRSRQLLLVHLAFLLVVATVPLTLPLTTGVSSPAVRWLVVHGPFWVWLVAVLRRSTVGMRIALLAWVAASVGAAALAGPAADLTVVPRVVWIVAEVGLALHFLGQWLQERFDGAGATVCEVLSDVALVAAITTGVTWFLARGGYEVSARLAHSGEVARVLIGSIGALVGVAVSAALIRTWFRVNGHEVRSDPQVLAAH